MGNSFWSLGLVSVLASLSLHTVVGLPHGNGYASNVVSANLTSGPLSAYEGQTSSILVDADVDSSLGLARRTAQDFYLRLMPLGASITQGVQSTDGNGYRKGIREQLRWKGWEVNMVGSKEDGNMADKDNEGHPGWVITQVHDSFTSSKWMMPNLVLLNAGTNDCVQNLDTGNAGARLKVLVDDIFSSIPGVTVILSTILPATNYNDCASSVSQQIRDLAATYSGARLQLADHNSFITLSDLSSDGIHPMDAGYMKMAAVWWNAISKAEGNMQAPANVPAIVDSKITTSDTCAKVAGTARGPVQTQQGNGHDDGMYSHSQDSMGNLPSGKVMKGDYDWINSGIPGQIYFARIINSDNTDRTVARDDWVRVETTSTFQNRYWVRPNLGGGNFGDHVQFDVGLNCDAGPYYAWADFNNDGLDDFWCLGAGSTVSVSLNRGGNPPVFESIGQVVPTHDGYDADDVRIADIDGDGRADYCLVEDTGDVICSRNGGQGDNYTWQGFTTQGGLRGLVFPTQNKGDKRGVRFGDLNGDFRTDWMWIGDQGDVDTWINRRGSGSGIVPEWAHPGVTHPGVGTAGVRNNIRFGRIYGSGRLDYVYMQEVSDGFEMHVWQNTGAGGRTRMGDGAFYCDMRASGSEDYLWIYQDGHTDSDALYTNIHAPPEWGHETSLLLSVPGPRVGIHLADWDGDGKCDVLVQDKASGALTLWHNQYDSSTNTLSFEEQGVVSGAASCTQGWGVGIYDRGIRLADIDGDGRADILCIEPNGRITAWLHEDTGLVDVGQVKYSVGGDRADIRLADVEASGRKDLIYLDKWTGAGTVYKNLGHTPASGSSFSWDDRGVLYSAIDRGETMHFVNQGGLGRADLVHVLPDTNVAYTYFNECSGSTSGGDDGPIVDPGLPAYSS